MKIATIVGAAALLLNAVPALAVNYTYESSSSNVLMDLPPLSGFPRTISFSLDIPFVLSPNSAYDISITNSPTLIQWGADDSQFGVNLSGFAPIDLAPGQGHINGGALNACNLLLGSCFGGTLLTNASGAIVQWNLVADGGPGNSSVSFISYNTPVLGSVDGLVSPQQGYAELALNKANTQTGTWNGVAPPTFGVGGIPEPDTWTSLVLGFLVAGGALRVGRPRRLALSLDAA